MEAYRAARGEAALAENTLLRLPLRSGGVAGLHPALPEIQDLFACGVAAIVANVGSTHRDLSPILVT